AIARCKRVSTGCGRKRRSVPAWPWICGVKPTPKAVNKPSPHCIVHGLDKPGGFTTVSSATAFSVGDWQGMSTHADEPQTSAILQRPVRCCSHTAQDHGREPRK